MKPFSLLRARRERAEIGLRELARAMRISPSYLSDMERGLRRLTPVMRERHRSALTALKQPSAGLATP